MTVLCHGIRRHAGSQLLRNMRSLPGRLLLCTNEFPGIGVEELKSETASAALEGVEVSFSAQSVVLSLSLGEVDLAVFHEAVVETSEFVGGGGGGLSRSESGLHLSIEATQCGI